MPVEMRVTTMEKGGSGNASTNTIKNTNNSYTLSESNPLYEASLRYKKKKEEQEEQENQKKLSEKKESDKKKAEYFTKTIQPFVSAYNQVVDVSKGYFEGWQGEEDSKYTKGLFTSLQDNYNKLKDAVTDNSYLQEVMSPEDYEKTISDLDLIGNSLSDAVNYVSNASSVYSQFTDADSYNKHTRLSGMTSEELQKEIDALDKQISAMGNGDLFYDTMYVMGQPMKKSTEMSEKYESNLAELEREKKELTSYRDAASLGENSKKYGVDPSKLSYEELTAYVNDGNLSIKEPEKYDFIKSYYDGLDANEKADLFVKGLDPTTKDLYEKASELITKNSASNVAFSQTGSTLMEASADLKRVDELIGIISSRTGFDEQTVRKNIGMVQRYMNAERMEETGKAVAKAVDKDPVLSNIASVGLNLGGGLVALADQVGQTIANKIAGENEDIDTNTAAQSIVKISDDIRNTTRKKIEKSTNVTLPSGANLGAYLYDTAMGLADVVAQTATGRVIGAGLTGKALNNAISSTTSLIVGSNSAASTVQESVENGESSVKALAKGLAVGLTESLIEKAGIDNVLNATLRGDAAAKVILRGALAEGTEEVLTNIATEDFLEAYVFNGSTRYQKAFESYINQGLSREDAAKRASADVVAQDAETFLSSAFIGAVFGGVTAVSNRANDKANTKLAQDGINNRIGGIGEIEFLKSVNEEMASAAEEFNRTHNDAQYKAVEDEVLRRITYIQSVKEDIRNNSSLRNVIGESGIEQEIQKLDANEQTLSEIRALIDSGNYDVSYQAELIRAKEEDLTKTTEEQAKSQRNVLKAAQMYLSAFGSEKKAVEAAKKTAAQEKARAVELSAERNRLTEALTTADETQKVEINRRIQEIGREIKRTARNVIRAGKVEKALGDQYRSAINSALGGNEKELSKRLTNALGREVKVAYDDNANGFSSMKTGADSSTLTVNPELILRTENALRQEFGEEYTGNLAKEKLVHEIAHAAARSDANFDANVLEIYHLLRDNGLITDDDIDEAATREAYKDTLKRYMATEPAKAEVRRLVEAGNAEADAIAAVENAYIGEELVAQTLEWMERATNGQLSREILGEKRNVFVQALNRIAEIFRSVAAKLKGVDNVNAAKTAGFADKIERFAREFAERGVAEMNEGKGIASQESTGATQSADKARGNSGEGAGASGESEATTGTQEEDERHSLDVRVVEAVRNGEPVSGEDEVRYSIEFNEKMMDAARRANNGAVENRIMDKAESDRLAVKRLFTDPKTSASLGLPPDIIGKTYIPNSSYSGTEENTTVCPRSLAADALMDAVAESIGRPLTVEDTLAISQEYWKYTDTPECLYCYVAMDRKAYREFLGSYLKQRDDVLADIYSGMDKESAYSKFLDGRKPTANMRKRFDMWVRNADNGADMISMEDLASDDAMQKAADRGRNVRDQVNDARKYAQSASWAKKRIGYAAYDGHILRWKQNRIDSLNSHYGLRMYSFSDFSPAFILENMQMITDAAVRKLKMLAYTKDLNFVKIFAKTGMNINVSVFAHEGKNGVMAPDGMQGADWTKARKLRDEYGNVGITFVATNDGQVDWALAQDWIDVVIPFHLVRTGAKVADSFGWKNYTAMSSDVKTKAWTSANAASVYPTEHQNNKEKYFEALRKNNLEPRFAQWAENPNYMKLVNETRQSAEETSPVQPVFDLGAAEDAIEEMRKRGGYYVPIGGSEEVMREIADEIASGIDGDERHSLDVEGDKITPTSTDAERMRILSGKTITDPPHASDLPDSSDISSWDDIDSRFGKEKLALVKKLASEFGVFKDYKNADIDLSFEFSANNFRESYSKQGRSYKRFAKMFSVFDGVVEKAVGIEAHLRDDYKPDPTLRNMYVLVSAFADGDEFIPVKMEIKEFSDKKNKLYVAVSLDGIKKTEVWKQGNTASSVTQNSRSVIISIPDLMRNVKPSDVNFTKYFPKSMLTDEQRQSLEESKDIRYSVVSAKELSSDEQRMKRMEEDKAFLEADFAKAERTSTVDEKKELGADLIRRFDLDKATAPKKLRDMFLLLERYATLASASDDAQEKSTAEAEAQPKSNRTYKIGDEVQKLEEVTSQIRQISRELIAESGGLDAELLLSENDAKGKEIIEEQANNLEMAAMLGYYAPVDENDTSNAYKARLSAIRKNMNMRMSRYIRRLERQADRITDLEDSAGGEKYRETIKKRTKAMRSMANNPNRKRFVEEKNRETVREITDWLDRVADATTAGGVGNLETELSTDALAVMEKKLLSLGDVFDEDSVDLMKMLLQQMAVNRDSYLEKEVNRELAIGRLLKTEKNLAWMMYKALRDQNRMELNGREYVANYIAGDLIESLNSRRNVEKEFNTLETDEKGKILSSSDSGKILERMEKSTRKTRRWISLNTMDGYSFLRRMGKVGESLYNTLRTAQSEQIMHVQEYVKTMQDKLLKDQQDGAKGVDLSRYIGDKQKTVTVTLSNGEKYTMTAAQAMTIVTLYEREAGKSHIENGGVRLVHPKDKTLSAAVALKAEDVAAIAQNLDEDDRRVMKVMNDFIREQCTEWGNEATLERYGFYRFNTQHYFPITVDRNALPSNVSAESAKDYLQFNVQNVGFAKAADASAKAPVVIDSFISVINRHVEGMATYAAYLNAEDIVNRLMSAPGVKDAMQRSIGTGAVKYMTDMMTELKQGNRGGSEDALTQWWNKSAGHYKSAAVSYNLSTALKQPISIVRAAAVLDPKYILAAKRVPFSGTGKAAHEEMLQYSGIGVKKSVGYSDVGVSRDINAQIGYEKKDLSKKVRDVSEFGMALAGYMDERTWDSIWIACREEVKDKKPDLTANHDAFMREVAKRFAEVVAQTQVVDSPLDSSPLSRSKNPLARNVFAFTSEPIKGFNLLMNAMDDLINAEKGSIRQKQAAAQMARTAVITLVGWAAEASISAAFQMIRDEDDDEGEIAKEFGVKFGKQMMSNAYNVVPYIGQAVDIILDAWKGYDFTDMGIAPLVDVIDSAKSVMDTLRNPENKSETIVKAGRDFVESVATFFGIPIRNFARDAFAVARLLFHGTDWYIHEYEMQKWFYNPKSSTAREKHEFNSLLTDAYLSGNKKAFEHIYNDMRSMGLSPQTIMNGIAKDAYAQDITSTGSTLTRYTPGSDAWYIGMKGIFDRDLSAPDGLEKELTRLYKATEEKGVLPKYKSDSYTVDGESKEMSVKDHEKVLAEYSKLYYEIATILRNSPAYKNADDTLKAYWMAQAERYAGAISIYRVDSEYNLRTKWWEKMKDKPYYDVAGYIIQNLKPSKEDE